jgi:hypothetical protein
MPGHAEWGSRFGFMEDLTQEQEFLLARVTVEAMEMSRQELIEALVEAWYTKFQVRAAYESILQAEGLCFNISERVPCCDPTDAKSLASLLGYEPTAEEAEDYFCQAVEDATMELDMDEIVLTPED